MSRAPWSTAQDLDTARHRPVEDQVHAEARDGEETKVSECRMVEVVVGAHDQACPPDG